MNVIYWLIAVVGLGLIGSTFAANGHPEWMIDRIGFGLGLLIVAAMIQAEIKGRQ